jgi:hypothetical protein
MIEWYDFYIFGSLATVISPLFYPPGNDTLALIAYLSTFAVGFVVRPFGALFFGRIGDLVGRKYTFLVTIRDAGGLTVTSSKTLTVAQTLDVKGLGYDYASTTATFDVVVTPGAIPSAVTAYPRQLHRANSPDSVVALPDDPRAAEDRRLAAARAEWQAETAFQFERTRAQWEAVAREQWAALEAALNARHAANLAKAESRWRDREVARIAAAEAQWNARAATRQARRRAEDASWLPAKPATGLAFKGGWILSSLLAAFGIACMALSALTL